MFYDINDKNAKLRCAAPGKNLKQVLKLQTFRGAAAGSCKPSTDIIIKYLGVLGSLSSSLNSTKVFLENKKAKI